MAKALHDDTAVLLIDAQTSFLEQMHGACEPLLARLERLLLFTQLLDLPIVATVERPLAEKGALPDSLQIIARTFEKSSFDAMAENPVREALEALGKCHIAVAGAETDVCVLFTVLSLRRLGYEVFLLQDCVFSSAPDVEAALVRMHAAGAIPTTLKSFRYELTGCVQAAWPDAWRRRLAERPELEF